MGLLLDPAAGPIRGGLLLHTGEWPGWAPPAPMLKPPAAGSGAAAPKGVDPPSEESCGAAASDLCCCSWLNWCSGLVQISASVTAAEEGRPLPLMTFNT